MLDGEYWVHLGFNIAAAGRIATNDSDMLATIFHAIVVVAAQQVRQI